MKKTIDHAAKSVTFKFNDGLESFTFHAKDAAAEMREYAELAGWGHRLGDYAALPTTDKDGNVIPVTEAMRRDAVLEIAGHYTGGATEWNIKPSARKPVQNAVILKVATSRGCTYEEAEAYIAEKFLADLDMTSI